jgi:hypothetical protein
MNRKFPVLAVLANSGLARAALKYSKAAMSNLALSIS